MKLAACTSRRTQKTHSEHSYCRFLRSIQQSFQCRRSLTQRLRGDCANESELAVGTMRQSLCERAVRGREGIAHATWVGGSAGAEGSVPSACKHTFTMGCGRMKNTRGQLWFLAVLPPTKQTRAARDACPCSSRHMGRCLTECAFHGAPGKGSAVAHQPPFTPTFTHQENRTER